jgi:transposase
MVMTLSLLIYSIAQRRLRKALKEQNEILLDCDKNAGRCIYCEGFIV